MRMRGRITVGLCLAIAGASCGRSGLDDDLLLAEQPDAGSPLPVCAVDAGACVGRQCQAAIDACACQNKPPTTISGYVYDPAGRLPLYGVYVYIPTTKPDPIAPGHPTCTQCQAPASGTPIVGAFTDAYGRFTLQAGPNDNWGVPSGDDLPIVLQIGKWRRQLKLPHIEACTANDVPDDPRPALKLRLPAMGSEGDMPLIAFTSGCDPAECFLREIGIDDSEFVPPDSPTGHIHFFTGYSRTGTAGQTGSAVQGGNQPTDTYAWWSSAANLSAYDVGSSRVDLQACKLEYSIVSPK